MLEIPGADQPPPPWKPTVPYADLTRKATGWSATDVTYTAIDLETTGLDPKHDGIVELGLVKFRGDGTVLDEFATLVNNPGSSPQAQAVHGIAVEDLIGAPAIEDVLREAFAFMAGTVVVAHNWAFEEGFLIAAAQHCGLTMPDILAMCTMKTAELQMDGRAYSLKVMYKSATGTFLEDHHNALADARAVRDILCWLLRNAPVPLHLTSAPPNCGTSRSATNACAISCRPAPLLGRASMYALLDSFPQSPNARIGDQHQVEKYLTLLDECLEDALLTFDEAEALAAQARRTRLTGTQLRQLHRQGWANTFRDSDDLSAVSATTRREMFLLAESLGLDDIAMRVQAAIVEHYEPPPPSEARYLRNTRVGIFGDTPELAALRVRAESYGAKLAVNITKTVQWMATTTPDAVDARHNAARQFGTPMLTPDEANRRIDDAVRIADLKTLERNRQIDEAEARRQQSRRTERDAYWRPVWRPTELTSGINMPEPPDGSIVQINARGYRYLATRAGQVWHTSSRNSNYIGKTEHWATLAYRGTGYTVITGWQPAESEPQADYPVVRFQKRRTDTWDAAIRAGSDWYSTTGRDLDTWSEIVRYGSKIQVACHSTS